MSEIELIKKLREKTGVSVMACKKALAQAHGDMEKAESILREQGLAEAEKKAGRPTCEGIIDAYVHTGGKIAAVVELQCETDFVARHEDFKELAHDLCLQVAATHPAYIHRDEVPEEIKERESRKIREQMKDKPEKVLETIIAGKLEKFYKKVCLLDQLFIKDENKTVHELIKEKIHKFGENIKVARIAYFEIGSV